MKNTRSSSIFTAYVLGRQADFFGAVWDMSQNPSQLKAFYSKAQMCFVSVSSQVILSNTITAIRKVLGQSKDQNLFSLSINTSPSGTDGRAHVFWRIDRHG